MRVIKYFLFSLLFLSSCDKFEWHNPYDPECPKELFTPSSPGATMEGNSVKLTWSQSNDDISGFALFRSAEGEPIDILTQTQKSTTQYLDASVTPGKKYTYYVLAVAGTNKSDTIKAEITPVFPITISTGAVTELAATSAKVSGNITSAGGGTVTSRGICWSTTQNPTVNNSKTTEGTGAGQYTSTLNGLLASTTYYARAYGENSRGIVYGSQVTFTTLGPPTVTTTAVSNITASSATSGGTIISDGGSPITAKGVVWSTSPNPTIASTTKTDDGTGVGAYSSTIANLTNNTKYYIRAYATNIVGTSYGEEQTFLTLDPIVEKLRTGLVAYYPFNGNANDESGNGNNGVIGQGITTSSDRKNQQNASLTFTGRGDITLTKLPTEGTQDFSISAWVRVAPQSGSSGIICWGQDSPWASVYLFIPNSGKLKFDFAYHGGPESLFTITDNLWHNVVVTNQSGLIQLFIDGIKTGNSQQMFPNISGLNKAIGSAITNSGLNYFVGLLDDIRIYNRALTQEEITYLANN